MSPEMRADYREAEQIYTSLQSQCSSFQTASAPQDYDTLARCGAHGCLSFPSFLLSRKPVRSASRITSRLQAMAFSWPAGKHADGFLSCPSDHLPGLGEVPPGRLLHCMALTFPWLAVMPMNGFLSCPFVHPSGLGEVSTGPLLHCMAMTFSCSAAKHADGFLSRSSCHLTGPVEVPRDSFYTAWL